MAAIDKKRRQLLHLGKMKDGVLNEDIQFGRPSMAAKVLIGNSGNGNIVRMDSNGYTHRQFLAEK